MKISRPLVLFALVLFGSVVAAVTHLTGGPIDPPLPILHTR